MEEINFLLSIIILFIIKLIYDKINRLDISKYDDSKILSRLNRVEHTNEFNSLSITELEDKLKVLIKTIDEHKLYIIGMNKKLIFTGEIWQQKLVREEMNLIYDDDSPIDIDLTESYNENIELKKNELKVLDSKLVNN